MSQTQHISPLDRLLEPFGRSFTPDVARELADLRAAPEVQARGDELAEKCNEDSLTDEERSEYEGYVQAIHLIGTLQTKAQAVLAGGPRQP